MKLLFLAMSESQARYYYALCEHDAIEGEVLLVNELPRSALLSGYNLVRKNDLDVSAWLNYKLLKIASSKGYARALLGYVMKPLLTLEIFSFVGAFNQKILSFKPDAIVVLNGAHYKQQAALSFAKINKVKTLFIELGCLPNSTQVDSKGVNYFSSLPRDPAFYMNHSQRNNELSTLVSDSTVLLEERKSVKAVSKSSQLPEQFVFVPFQVHDDTQILLHSPWLPSMNDLYHALEKSLVHLEPSVSFVVKEHPSDKKNYTHLHLKNKRIVFANGNNTQELIEHSNAVITINSTVGIEALMLKKTVITLGNAFYNIKGLVYTASRQKELNEIVKAISSLKTDNELRFKFLAFLRDQYLVKGRHKTFTNNHINRMIIRIIRIIGLVNEPTKGQNED